MNLFPQIKIKSNFKRFEDRKCIQIHLLIHRMCVSAILQGGGGMVSRKEINEQKQSKILV